jgi:hypothetical protein
LSEDCPQIFGTDPYVRDRPFVFGFCGENRVLFEGVPADVAMCPYVSDDGGDVHITVTERPVHSILTASL